VTSADLEGYTVVDMPMPEQRSALAKDHLHLLSTMDGHVWAKEFMALYDAGQFAGGIDVDLMRAWFANAIMVGYDHGAAHAERRLLGTKAEPRTLKEIEARAITHVLTLLEGNISAAARQLGVDRRTLYRRKKEEG
jgi:transcriptional regulator of acetoin/glycerol metabolism